MYVMYVSKVMNIVLWIYSLFTRFLNRFSWITTGVWMYLTTKVEVRYTWRRNMAVSKCVKPCSIRMVSRYGYGVSSKIAKSNILW